MEDAIVNWNDDKAVEHGAVFVVGLICLVWFIVATMRKWYLAMHTGSEERIPDGG